MTSDANPRFVVDTNVLVSAFGFGGLPEKLIKKVWQGASGALTSDFILQEFSNVCARKHILPEAKIIAATAFWRSISELVKPLTSVDVVKQCVADNRILECAVDGHADFIVTGDHRHLLPLKRHQGIAIVTVRDFLNVHS